MSVRGTLAAETFWFGSQNSIGAIPNRFTNLTIGLGADYRFLDRFFLRADFLPELSLNDGDTSLESVSFTLTSVVGYRASDSVLFFGGVLVQSHLEFPVIPVVGARWMINRQWTLEAGIPKTALTFALTSDWELFASGQLKTSQFRTEEGFAIDDGDEELGDDWLSYLDIRVAGGIAYKFGQTTRIGLETGASVYRRFAFSDADFEVDAGPAPYAAVQLTISF